MSSSKFLLKTISFSPGFGHLCLIFAKGGQDPPREPGQEQKQRRAKAGLQLTLKIVHLGTTYPQWRTEEQLPLFKEAERDSSGDQHYYGVSGAGIDGSSLG